MEAASLWTTLVSTYMSTECSNSEDRNQSTEKLKSFEKREMLEIFEPKELSFRYNVGYRTQADFRFP
jgi:hypothetical protein